MFIKINQTRWHLGLIALYVIFGKTILLLMVLQKKGRRKDVVQVTHETHGQQDHEIKFFQLHRIINNKKEKVYGQR